MSRLNIVGIAASLRAQSYSKMVLQYIADLLPPETAFDLLDIGALPHYSGDLEAQALPASVVSSRQLVRQCDALVLVVPEYHHGMPGVLKNTLDWLSRPVFASCMQGKPVFFVTLSEGALGGVRAQYQLRETFASMQCQLLPLPEIAITHIGAKVVDGQLRDQATGAFIEKVLGKFLAEIERQTVELQA